MKSTRFLLLASLALLMSAGIASSARVTTTATRHTTAATISPQTALDWNLITVNTVRAATPAKFQIEGTLYVSYVQAAV